MSKVGLHVSRVVDAAYPRSPTDVKTAWSVVMPQLYDSKECVQFGCEYILSLGAHDTHENLLLSASHVASIPDIRQIENLISYLFDAPCLLTFPNRQRSAAAYYKGLASFFRFLGYRTHPQIYSVEGRLAEIWETIDGAVSDGYMRLLPRRTSRDPQETCWACERPSDDSLNRALAVYRQALVSPEPQGMILNYWRSLEAITTKSQRYEIAENLATYRLKPVRAFDPHTSTRPKPFNLVSRYRRHVLRYFSALAATHGTPIDVMDHLYKNRRNPAAHAEESILDIDGAVTLVSLYEDALLLKCISRCAIEQHWRTLPLA